MNPIDYIVIGIIVLLLGGIITYMVLNKKRNKGCVGCPCSGQCHGKCLSNNAKVDTN